MLFGVVALALLVLVANAGTDGPGGEALRTATSGGLSAAVLVVAAGIAATALVALNLRPDARAHAMTPGTGCREESSLATPPSTTP